MAAPKSKNLFGQLGLEAVRRSPKWPHSCPSRWAAGMMADFLDLELVDDREIVAALAAETSSFGRLLICHGCGDVEALIVAFLVLEQEEKAWPLCGRCVRMLPFQGAVT